MAFYRCELGYTTKRGGVALGLNVKAFGPQEAQNHVEAKHLHPYPARKFAYFEIREATEKDLLLGYSDASPTPREKP